MSMLGYAVSPELAISALGRPFWKERLPNIYASGLTRREIDVLNIYWRKLSSRNISLSCLKRGVCF